MAPHTALLVGRLGVHENLGGTDDPNCPKGYSVLYNIKLKNKTRGGVSRGATVALRLAGQQSAGIDQLRCASLVL